MNFKIPGAPIALQRAKPSRHGGFYDSQRHIKNAMSIYLQHYTGPLLEGPQFLFVIMRMPIPKTASKKRIQELLHTFHAIKPDGDNLEKFLNDFCQLSGNIFKDDACIAGVLRFKVWELNHDARTDFEFVSLNGKKLKQTLPPISQILSQFID